jgi:hypothetical protein
LKKDKGLPTTMLHVECYKHGYRGDGEWWRYENKVPNMLKNIEHVLWDTYVIAIDLPRFGYWDIAVFMVYDLLNEEIVASGEIPGFMDRTVQEMKERTEQTIDEIKSMYPNIDNFLILIDK